MPTAASRSVTPSRHAFALLALLAALPPALRADDCMSDPAEGIFCGGDESSDFEIISVTGNQSATWTSSALVAGRTYYYTIQPGSSLQVAAADDDYYRAKIFASGSGDFRLVAGYLRVHSFGAFTGDFHLTGSHLAGSLYDTGGNWQNSSVFHLTDATLRLERSQSFGSYNTFANALVLSGSARLEIVAPEHYDRADIVVAATNVVSGDGALVKTGPGFLRLEAANTYSGGTRIESGNLEVFADAGFGAAATAVTLAPDAGLWLNDGFASSARALTLEGGLVYLGMRSGSAAWNGALSGEGAFFKTGAGTLTLGAAGSFSGVTSVSAGVLRLGHAQALGASTLDTDGAGSLSFGTLSAATLGGLSGSGPLPLKNASDQALVLTLDTSAASAYSGALSGPGSLVKTGAATFTLSGAASHTGSTTIRGGTLKTGAANVLSAASSIFLIHNATLDLAGHDQTVGDLDSWDYALNGTSPGTVKLGGATLTNLNRVTNNWAGSLTGHGTLVKKGAATMNWSGANTFTGTLQIDAGTVAAQAPGTLSPNAAVQLATGSTLALNDHAQTAAGLSGSGEVRLGSAALTLAQDADTTFSGRILGIGGTLVKTGAGTLTLSGENSFSGDLHLHGGAVRVAADSALGFSTGRLLFSGGALETSAPLASARALLLSASGTVRAGADTTLSGPVSGAGSLTKTGDAVLTLSGDNSHSGGTAVQAGTLRAGHDNAFGAGGIEITGGTLDLAGFAVANSIANRGGTLTGLASYAGTQTIHGAAVFSGAVGGSLVIASAASLDSTGAVFTGPVTVQAGGALSGAGTLGTLTLAAGATLSPGDSPGLLSIGDGSILSGTTLFELGGLERGSGYDAIDVLGPVDGLGSLTVGGTLQVVFYNDWTPSGSASFQLLRASSIGGTFAQIELPALAAGYSWSTARLLTEGALDLIAPAIPEPASAAALAGLGLLGFAAARRRRAA